ncbi:MAG: hypothetical protein ACRDMJ_02750, partial [Solirubrobacteraceae bacterium]
LNARRQDRRARTRTGSGDATASRRSPLQLEQALDNDRQMVASVACASSLFAAHRAGCLARRVRRVVPGQKLMGHGPATAGLGASNFMADATACWMQKHPGPAANPSTASKPLPPLVTSSKLAA